MRKIFFLLSITLSGAASAQQQDIFDIQQHLQSKKPQFPKQQNPVTLNQTISVPPLSVPGHSLSLPLGAVLEYSDGTMPCIKVNMDQFRTMPNLADTDKVYTIEWLTRIHPGQMPNAAVPYLRFEFK